MPDTFNYFLVSLFPAQLSSGPGISDSARLSYISDRPYTSAARKGDELLTFVVNSLIHADHDVGFLQARTSKLVSIAAFGKFSDAILRKQPECLSVSRQISCPIQCCCRSA